MILYHGTSTDYLDQILNEGILPRKVTQHAGNYGEEVPSPENLVYLTSAYAVYYAHGAAKAKGSNPVVFAVEADESDLYPDEDFIADCLRRAGQGEWKQLRKDRHPYLYEDYWRESLDHNGVVCTHAILPEQILDHRIIPRGETNLLFALGMDALPSMDNFTIYGALYRDCMAALFAERDLSTLEERLRSIYQMHGEESW